MKTIALFGGSFDPPHLGHCAVIKTLLEIKEVDEIIIMPTYLNPFKESFFAPAELRLKWLKEIFCNEHKVRISDFEVKQNKKVPTLITVENLHKEYDKIYLVIGADNLKNLHLWHGYNELEKQVTFMVAHRNRIKIPKNYTEIEVSVDISSSMLRQEMKEEMLCEINAKEIVQYYKTKEYNARQN